MMKSGNRVCRNRTTMPVSSAMTRIINDINNMPLCTELVLTTVLSVGHDFHFTDNKTETQRNQVTYSRSHNEFRRIPNPSIPSLSVVWVLANRRQKIQVDPPAEVGRKSGFYSASVSPWERWRHCPWSSRRPLPPLTPAFALMAPTYIHSASPSAMH